MKCSVVEEKVSRVVCRFGVKLTARDIVSVLRERGRHGGVWKPEELRMFESLKGKVNAELDVETLHQDTWSGDDDSDTFCVLISWEDEVEQRALAI